MHSDIKRGAAAGASTLTLALAGAFATALPLQAQAQSGEPYKWEAAIYGWFPAIGGTTAFPPSGGGPSIDMSSKDVIDALKFAFMAQMEVRQGQWGLWTDLVYADFGGSKSRTRDFSIGGVPASIAGSLSLDVKTTIWSLAGVYNLESSPASTTDLVFGARMLDMKQTLDYNLDPTLLPNASGSARVDLTNWDAIVGLKGRYAFGDDRRWFVPYYVDVGTGESKLTWQAIGGVGYKFDWGSMFAMWRYLDYDFKSDKKIESLTMNGPLIGVAFQW